jgi:transcriptional regulator with XRE-family HTH domain
VDTKTETETEAFAQRLRRALEVSGVRASPTVVANEFNLRYWGRSITPHTARNWLLGKSIPTQDKLRVLSDWLQVSPDELRFGRPLGQTKAVQGDSSFGASSLADREMLSRYLALSIAERIIVRDVVEALCVAATVKKAK